jgi:hypothetical protein
VLALAVAPLVPEGERLSFAAILAAAPRADAGLLNLAFVFLWSASAPRPASARCIPGCPTPMPRARRRSPPSCPACC